MTEFDAFSEGRRRPLALITGGGRGLGLEIARQLARRGHDLLLAVRDPARARDALIGPGSGARVRLLELDLARMDAHAGVLDTVATAPIDVLVNNAGVYPTLSFPDAPLEAYRLAMEVHLFGPLQLTHAVLPGMLRRNHGRIVNLSSGAGSYAEGMPGPAPYGISKAALNALTARAARELPAGVDIKINAVCPGWVRTEMGGPQAPLSPAQGADTAVWLATLGADGPSGGLFRFRKPIGW